MKSFICLLVFFTPILWIPCSLKAQIKKGDKVLEVNLGWLSLYQFGNSIIGLGGDKEMELYDGATASFIGSYKYFISRKTAIGFSLGYQAIRGETNNDWAVRSGNDNYRYNEYHYTFAPEITIIYKNRKNFYSYALIGLCINNASRNYNFYNGRSPWQSDPLWDIPWSPTFQISPFGFKFGNIITYGWEFGYGYKGMINLNISANINSLLKGKEKRNKEKSRDSNKK